MAGFKRNKHNPSALFTMGNFVMLLSLVTVGVCGFVLWAGYGFFRAEFPNVSALKAQFPVVHYRGRKLPPTVTLQKSRPSSWAGLNEISTAAVGAIVVSEDWAFYQHKGYDPAQIRDAIHEDLEKGKFKRGASTITQQVVKNVFLEADKTLWRKAKELWLAIRLEEAVGKKKILETYLNVAEWGEGVYGIRAAANLYFKKSPAELSAKEGAFLAMLLPSPIRYGQSYRRKNLTSYASRTVASILDKMTQAHYIDEDERSREVASPLSFEASAQAEPLPPADDEGPEAGSSDTAL